MSRSDLLLTFYGDDFTGSTDSLEVLARSGIRSILFLQPPTEARMASQLLSGIRAVGVAGIARSLPVDEMPDEIEPALRALSRLSAPVFHYKICSTLDSSPSIGSIGRAVEVVRRHLRVDRIPLLPGAPFLKRYVAFGNLFATVEGVTHRLDRHPTMSRHPVTPMDEADVRRHLGRQTDLPIDLIDCRTLEGGMPAVSRAWENLPPEPIPRFVLFDTMRDQDLDLIGMHLWETRPRSGTRFIVGSSGVEAALASAWAEAGLIDSKAEPTVLPEVDAMVAISGSASPQTREQIECAVRAGWIGIRLDPAKLCGTGTEAEDRRLIAQAADSLRRNRSVVLYSALGPDDPALLSQPGIGARIGRAQGRLLKAILETTGIRRALVAGGDTSGHAAKELGIYALQFASSVAPGGPICRALSDQPLSQGLEILLKGGQVGPPDFFEDVRRGGPRSVSPAG